MRSRRKTEHRTRQVGTTPDRHSSSNSRTACLRPRHPAIRTCRQPTRLPAARPIKRVPASSGPKPVARNTPGLRRKTCSARKHLPGPAPCRAFPARLRRKRPAGKSRRTVRDAAKSRQATDRRDDRLAAELAESLRARIGYHRRAAIRKNCCRTSLFLILGTCL